MTLRTFEELTNHLRTDLAWRRKEFVVLETLVKTSADAKQQAVLRGAVAALYAHWEGFVKTAADAYIDFVRTRGLSIGELAPCFVGMIIRGRVKHLANSGRSADFTNFVEWMVREWPSRAFLPVSEKLSTQSNLSASVFRDIVDGLGLDYRNEYAVAEKTIMGPLLADRNNLAHGEWLLVKAQAFYEYRMWVDRLVTLFCEDIENAAARSLYRRSTSAMR